MKLLEIDFHGKNQNEAFDTIKGCIDGLKKHSEAGIVFIHGKGNHSRKAVLRQSIRDYLSESTELQEQGYMVILGEEPYPITEGYDGGSVLVVKKGYENESTLNGRKQKEKNEIVSSDEGRALRRNSKKIRAAKRKNRSRKHYVPWIPHTTMTHNLDESKSQRHHNKPSLIDDIEISRDSVFNVLNECKAFRIRPVPTNKIQELQNLFFDDITIKRLCPVFFAWEYYGYGDINDFWDDERALTQYKYFKQGNVLEKCEQELKILSQSDLAIDLTKAPIDTVRNRDIKTDMMSVLKKLIQDIQLKNNE